MVVKSIIKLIKSLQQKKYRYEHQLFVVEGKKSVEELLESKLECYGVYHTVEDNLINSHPKAEVVSTKELAQMSSLKTPPGILGVFHFPKPSTPVFEDWSLVLDDIRDPGNLGTIIRLCDWFGIRQLICSKQTVDCYNPKTLQATMGSISRVQIHYQDIKEFLAQSDLPIYGAFMDGNSIYKVKLPQKGILIMGNEANGISEDIENLMSHRISIPSYGDSSTESLNVAMATGILLNEIRRS
jgi:TrmH family RNA methyltransferase